jgi:hypothetical protein
MAASDGFAPYVAVVDVNFGVSALRDRARQTRHTVTPALRTRSGNRIATCRAPSTDTVNAHRPDERGALRLTHWLEVLQAGVRASYFRKMRRRT